MFDMITLLGTCVFFFKQKTAYEMRISDWSSDVCSSDLLAAYASNRRLLISRDVTQIEKLETTRRDFVANVSHELRTPLTVLAGFLETLREIGRASCRERGCQYV